MTETADYRRAIIEYPDDWPPRLAYASLVGGDYGEFITLQVRVDGDLKDGNAAPDLIRATQLLDTRDNRDRWSASLPADVSVVDFYRGFPEHVLVDAGWFIDHHEELFAGTPVRHLDVTGLIDEATCRAFFEVPWLGRIVGLGLDKGFHHAALTGLATTNRLVALQYLWLPADSFSDGELNAILRGRPSLEMFSSPDFDEEVDADWDGTLLDIVAPPRTIRFETAFGVYPALHAKSRNRRATRGIF